MSKPYDGMGGARPWKRKHPKKPPYECERQGVLHVLCEDLDIQLFASLMVMDVQEWLYNRAEAEDACL